MKRAGRRWGVKRAGRGGEESGGVKRAGRRWGSKERGGGGG